MKSAITATKKFKFRNRSRFLKKKMKSKFYDLAESSDVRCNHAAIIINRRLVK